MNYVTQIVDLIKNDPSGFDIVVEDSNATDRPSVESRTAFPNSDFDACINDIALNLYDMCIADYWVTPERADIISFVMPIFAEEVIIVTKVETDILIIFIEFFSIFT